MKITIIFEEPMRRIVEEKFFFSRHDVTDEKLREAMAKVMGSATTYTAGFRAPEVK